MSTDSRRPGDHEALTPDERAMADRLARLGPQGEPSPTLDARILGAARAAAAAPASGGSTHASRRRSRRRWPVALGTAATLVIVGGMAWQLRPVDEMHVEYSEAPRAVSVPSANAASAPQEARRAPVAGPDVEPAAASAELTPPEAESAAAAAEPAVARAVQPAPPPPAPAADEQAAEEPPAPKAFAAPTPAPEEPPVVFDEPSPMDTPSPPPAPAPPPPAPPAPPAPAASAPVVPSPMIMPQATDSTSTPAARRAAEPEHKSAAVQADEAAAQQRAKVATGTSARRAQPVSAAAAVDASSLDRIQVTGSRIDAFDAAPAVDQPVDDLPPASADSPQVQRAWLQRVRELLAEGKPDAARESLREYQRRYPEAELPEDLRTLLSQ